jgi:PAT family beta-lactamase induction signal transducer AmpG
MPKTNLLDSRRGRLSAFGILYISEGVPYGFTSTAMVAFMRMEGLTLEQIGLFVAALFLPWSFKWLWAPLIDIVRLERYGGRKAWIVFCTIMMIATLTVTSVIDFSEQFDLLLWMIVTNNFFCATQDVAIDSLAVSTLRDEERATGNGYMFGGQYFGIALGGGGAIFVSGLWGFDASLAYVSVLLLANLVFCLMFIQDPIAAEVPEPRTVGVLKHFAGVLGAFVRNLYTGFMESGSGPKLGLLFAFFPRGAIALAYALLATLQVDYGLTESQISQVAILNAVMVAFGCVIGGKLSERIGVKTNTGLFMALSAIPTVYLGYQISAVGLSAVPLSHFYAVVLSHGLIYGLAYGSRMALFLGLTSPAVAATQFTAYMGIVNLSVSITNYWQGTVAERFDYTTALYIDAALIVLGLGVLPFIKNREPRAA